MFSLRAKSVCLCAILLALAVYSAGCATQASKKAEFFGKVEPPPGQVLRYISGSEPESLDPQVGTGQPEARIYMAFFEGLVEYDPKTMEPIPAIAETWDTNKDSSEFIFHLRKNARFSNGDPITAQDFVYTFRRGLAPALAARNGYLAYEIKYAQGYNEGGSFVRDTKTGKFVTAAEVEPEAESKGQSVEPAMPANASPHAAELAVDKENPSYDTDFHHFMHEPVRLVVAGDEKGREKEFKANPKLRAALENKELVPVKAEDIGVEAIDDYTFRLSLTQPAPYFIGLMPHQFFRAVPRKAIEQWGDTAWTLPEHIVTSGPFKLKAWKPYNEIVAVKDPMYWDAANVRLNQISFYPLEETTTMMNLYKAGEVDAVFNHNVPVGWLDQIRPLKDYMDAPEVAIEYYQFNTTRPPFTDKRVRKAFNMAVDKKALAEYRKIVKPLTAFTPEGIFPGYPQPKGDDFNPEKAKQLLAEAGFKDASGKFDPKKFPINEVELTYNTAESNRQVAEFVQAQWKQNLGLTVSLKNMEFKTFLQSRAKLEYKGLGRAGWVGDYMDPYTFLALFSTVGGDNGTGWYDPKYANMLKEANRQSDPQKRYELLAKAEAYMLDAQPVIPLMTNATNWVKKPYVKGMYPNPGTLHAWKFVYIEDDRAKWDYGVPKLTSDKPTTAE
ncbi:MAG: peptide ABC transporter substrate-binding protein [Acidobacteria bacterium]|nr:peptide ABC transporter substrate-binding protein [Acidobacteriota bacterium]